MLTSWENEIERPRDTGGLDDVSSFFKTIAHRLICQEHRIETGLSAKTLKRMTITDASEPSAKKPRTTKPQKQQLSEAILVDDYDQTDPEVATTIVQAREKKKAKSKRLSESMKARWADGRMKGPMAKRAANNAIKKAERLGQTGTTVNGKEDQDTEIDADEAEDRGGRRFQRRSL